MFSQFHKKPFKARIKDTGYLLKNSFVIIGKDSDIIKPTIRMAIYSVVLITLFFISLLTFFTGSFVGTGILILLFVVFILFPFKFFYYVRQKANQSWIVYNTITGKDISYADAHAHTRLQKSRLRIVAIVDVVVKFFAGQRTQDQGIVGFLINLFLAALLEIWDLLSHYMIPAIVVEQKKLRELIPKIKELRQNVPAALVGVFGIDFVGNVVGFIVIPLYFFVLLVGVGIGWVVAQFELSTAISLGGFAFSWVPVFIAFYFVVVIGTVIRKMVDSTKVIYFTIFYTAIMHPKEITADMRTELTHYLKMDKQIGTK